MIRNPFIALSLASFVGLACACTNNSTATDDTPLEPSRDARIRSLASAACDRYADTAIGCPGYGTGSSQTYATEGDCERDVEERASNLWPAARCSDDRIDSAAYQRCEDRVKTYVCSTGVTNVFDGIAALEECDADRVCVDPAR